mmetsp:Transcript_59744/g.122578  ORF Transcript_59744/g.122578 Transcript_59744/m.122578 type:complete len:136 (-) Transcript_59744:624-1031(-)
MEFFSCCSSRIFDAEKAGRDFEARTEDNPGRSQGSASNVCGLGIALKPKKDGSMYVKRLVPGGPAQECGEIQVDDILEKVNQINVFGMDKHEVAKLLTGTGEEGTTVDLRFLRVTGKSQSSYINVKLTRKFFEEA